VMKAVKELDYEPNVMGRNLRNSQNKTVLVAGLGFVEAMMTGIYMAAGELGYEVILMHTRMSEKSDYIRRIKNGLTSGILFMNMLDEEIMTEISASYPLVQCGSAVNMPNACSVSINDEAAVYDLTERLLRQGRRRIALISSTIAGIVPQMTKSRKKGFLKAMADHQVTIDPQLMVTCDFLKEDFSPALEIAEWFAGMDPAVKPDAVICEQNILAVTCVNVFREAGLAVPVQIAVASLDDQPLNTVIKPTITAIRHPYEAMGREAMQLLAAIIENKLKSSRQIVFKHDLIQRGSTNF
jgi:LacI family repressor for deo operon, udp, cdd, tsx, nupC, and nupG